MSKKRSVTRLKPRPENCNQFLADLLENEEEREPFSRFTVSAGDEVIAGVIRDEDHIEESAKEIVVNWLDKRRPMLQEFYPVNR
jgi:hypothetical protein